MDTFTIDIKPKATIEACGRLFKVNGAKSAVEYSLGIKPPQTYEFRLSASS